MNYEVKGIHYEVSDTTREHIDKKMKRLQFASDLVTDISLSLIREKNGYKVDANTNFRWGTASHLSVECKELYKGIEVVIDKLENKVRKEKEKIQEHKA